MRTLVILMLSVVSAFAQTTRPLQAVNTVADLVARTPVTNERLLVSGWRTVGDWGAQRVVRHDPDSVLATNLGCVFDNAGTGRYLAEDCEEGEIDVRKFGAVGDGTLEWQRVSTLAATPTDDTASIQAAIDWATQAGTVKRIKFPRGYYRVTSTLNLTAPQGILLVGDGGSQAFAEAIADGTPELWSYTDIVRDGGGNWPLLFLHGATNSVTDPNYSNYQSGVTWSWGFRDIGFRDRQLSVYSGTTAIATNIAPLVKSARAVHTKWNNVRFGNAHGSHIWLFQPDDNVFDSCYFNGGALYTNDWSTRVWSGAVSGNTNFPGEDYPAANTIVFDKCTWEATSHGDFWAGGPNYSVNGLIIRDCFFKKNYPNENCANLHLSSLFDSEIAAFVSGSDKWSAHSLITHDQLVYMEGTANSGNAARGMVRVNLHIQNLCDNVNNALRRAVFLTNMSGVKLDVLYAGGTSLLESNVVVIDGSCNNVEVSGEVFRYTQDEPGVRLSNLPVRNYGVQRFLGDGQYGVMGTTNADYYVTTPITPLGTNDFTAYWKVKLPQFAPNVEKYLGGVAESPFTNAIGGASSLRFYVYTNGEFVVRQAGPVTAPQVSSTRQFRLYDYNSDGWLDIAVVRGSNQIKTYVNGNRYVNDVVTENIGGAIWLDFADNVVGASMSQWDGVIQVAALMQGALTDEEVWRLPIDGAPNKSSLVFWHDFRPNGNSIVDRGPYRNHGTIVGTGSIYSFSDEPLLVKTEDQSAGTFASAGSLWFNSTSNRFQYWDTSSNRVALVEDTGSGIYVRSNGVWSAVSITNIGGVNYLYVP